MLGAADYPGAAVGKVMEIRERMQVVRAVECLQMLFGRARVHGLFLLHIGTRGSYGA